MSKRDAFEFYGDLLSEDNIFGTMTDKASVPEEDGDLFVTAGEMKRMEEGSIDGELQPPGTAMHDPDEEETFTVFKTFHQPRTHKYSESEMARIRASCDTVIVHDFGAHDRYHWSDEEVANSDALNEIRMKLDSMTKAYRRIDKYIIAMRTVMEAWRLLEKKYNFVHTQEEFYAMVANGTIYSSGIIVPRMKGLDRYNLDLVIKYISNPELDPKDLVPMDELKKELVQNAWYSDVEDEDDYEDADTIAARVLDEDEQRMRQQRLNSPDMKLPELRVWDLKPKYVRGYDTRTVFGTSKKKKKKMSKQDRFTAEHLHPLLRKIQRNPEFRSAGRDMNMSMLISTSMFEPQEVEKRDVWGDIVYKGSWADEDSTELFELAMDELARDQHPDGDRYRSYADIELMNFFNTLEETGKINVTELRRRMNSTEEDRSKAVEQQTARNNKKAESALLQRIIKLNNNPKFKKLIGKAEKALNKSGNK